MHTNARARSRAVSLLALPVLGLLSCADNPAGLPPTPSLRPQREISQSELDAIMAKRPGDYEQWTIAKAVPGFGGIFIDTHGTVTVVLTDITRLQAAEQQVRKVYQLESNPRLRHPMRVVQGKYDFVALAKLHYQITPILTLRGVVSTDADERRNRVVIGVSSQEAETAVLNALSQLGVTKGDVIIEKQEPREPVSLLTDRLRPLIPGYVVFTSDAECTLGLTMHTNGGPSPGYFLTPSHCTDAPGSVEGTVFFQNTVLLSDRIGAEVRDAPLFSGGECPQGSVCQRADAALGRYDNVADGQLNHLPVMMDRKGPFQGFGSIEVAYCCQYIYGVYGYHPWVPAPILGQEMNKIGRRSGWTYGGLDAICVNGTSLGIYYLCENRVRGTAESGDSGAPVFDRQSVGIYGMATANAGPGSGIFYFAPMSSIIQELRLGELNLVYCYC